MSHPNSIIKGYMAQALIEAYRIVKFGTVDATAVKGAAAADASIGVSVQIDTAAGEVCDVVRLGPAEVRLGGTVTRGALLTSDATGKAIAATAAAGSNVRFVAIADAAGVADDIIPCTVVPGSFQG